MNTKIPEGYGEYHYDITGTGFPRHAFEQMEDDKKAALVTEMLAAMASERGPITDDEIEFGLRPGDKY